MEKKYQVFVSSTYEDLIQERRAVIENLLRLDCIPSGMELFRAANKKSWELIKSVIDECDYYLVIVAGRYGSLHEESKLSYTEMEYRYALEKKKPVVGFVHKDIGLLQGSKLEHTENGKSQLEEFTTLVKSQQCAFWTNPSDLAAEVVLSINDLKKSDPAVGWVRGDQVPEKGATEEILRLREQIDKLQNQLSLDDDRGTQQFAQGEDTFKVRYKFSGYLAETWRGADATFDAWFEPTWNELFNAIAPLMIDESSDHSLRIKFNNFCLTSNIEQLKQDDDARQYQLKNFLIQEDDFNTIKVQLLALKLIMKSEKKKSRGVNDKETYWTLTPHGESVMTALRAIRRVSADDRPPLRRRTRLATVDASK